LEKTGRREVIIKSSEKLVIGDIGYSKMVVKKVEPFRGGGTEDEEVNSFPTGYCVFSSLIVCWFCEKCLSGRADQDRGHSESYRACRHVRPPV
jgi:hypothetical protein